MLQEILKQATSKQHENLEQMMFVDKIMDGTLSAKQYKQILNTNYIVHACFEHQLFEGLDEELKAELEINKRIKLPALLKDLQELNMDQPEIEFHENESVITVNTAAILGAMYVLEGATLGGSVIVKRLKVNPNLQNLNLGFHYYQAYGANLGANWKKFCEVINTKVPATDYDKSINGALTMFEYFASAQKDSYNQQSVSQALS